MKKQQALIILTGAITVAVLAFAIGVFHGQKSAEPFTMDRLQDITYMRERLNLDPPQLQELMLLTAGLQEEVESLSQTNRAARQKLVQSIRAILSQEQRSVFDEMTAPSHHQSR